MPKTKAEKREKMSARLAREKEEKRKAQELASKLVDIVERLERDKAALEEALEAATRRASDLRRALDQAGRRGCRRCDGSRSSRRRRGARGGRRRRSRTDDEEEPPRSPESCASESSVVVRHDASPASPESCLSDASFVRHEGSPGTPSVFACIIEDGEEEEEEDDDDGAKQKLGACSATERHLRAMAARVPEREGDETAELVTGAELSFGCSPKTPRSAPPSQTHSPATPGRETGATTAGELAGTPPPPLVMPAPRPDGENDAALDNSDELAGAIADMKLSATSPPRGRGQEEQQQQRPVRA